jgi:sulfur relay (sulfurtransferase) complex TusBCD TusD component (DsrE family)
MTPRKPCLLIDSRDAFGRSDGGFARQLALQLAHNDVPVTLLLVQNAVLAARAGAEAAAGTAPAQLAAHGVTVLADSFALAERGIDAQRLAPGVSAATLEVVIDRLVEGWHVIWH